MRCPWIESFNPARLNFVTVKSPYPIYLDKSCVSKSPVISAGGWGLMFFCTRVWGSLRREKAGRINGGCSLVLAGISISLDHPRRGDRGEQRRRLWEHKRRRQETKESESERNRARVARPQTALTVPDLNIQHQIKHPPLRPWVAVSGYGMQLIHKQACRSTHITSLPAILSCKFLAIVK